MKATPILFQPDMVRAIQEGRKTQTRRIIKNPSKKIKYAKGDILWVREKFRKLYDCKTGNFHSYDHYASMPEKFYTTPEAKEWKWKPSIFMPKDACRIFLEITDVRVEKLNSISDEDAIREGVESIFKPIFDCKMYKEYTEEDTWIFQPKESFLSLWTLINGIESSRLNPSVCVIEFKRVKAPDTWQFSKATEPLNINN